MPQSALVFSKARLEGLPVPAKRRVYHYDQKTPGLCIAVMPTGRKVFYVYRWVAGRPTRIRIGRFPDISLETARKQAAELNAAIARGEDPQAQRRQQAAELTLGALWEHWLENYAKIHKRSWKQDLSMWEGCLRPWKGRRLSSITPAEVQRLHSKVGLENGQARANRVVSLLRAMYRRAARELSYSGPQPAAHVTRFREVPRDRFLTADEVKRLLGAVLQESPINRDAILLGLFTGVRKANLLGARWQDIDLDRAVWRIPETDAKSGLPIIIPLASPAVEVLRQRQAFTNGPWVFPGRGRTGHVAHIKFAWSRVCGRAGIEGAQFHDLRRTLASVQANLGTSIQVIGRSLGHTSIRATEIYAKLSLDPVRESVEKATAAMLAAGGMLEVEGPRDED